MRRIISSLLVSLLCPALLMAQAETEPNDNTGQANALTLGIARTGDIGGAPCISGSNQDWFSLSTALDGTLSMNTSTTASSGSGTLRVHVYDGNGTLITYYDHGAGPVGSPASQTSSLICVGKGTYYFLLAALSGDCYAYAFTVTRTVPVFADDSETNNNTGEATVLAHNAYMEGHVNFSYTGDNDDWYLITTPAEGSATFTTIAESEGGGNVRTHLYDGAGNLITYYDGSSGANHDDDTTTYTHDCLGQGNYYLRITSIGGCGHGYKLKYQTAGAVYANDVEPNNNTGQAFANGALAHNTFTEGHINFSHYGDNSDWYFIQTPAEGTIRLTAIAERVPLANGTIRVHLYDGSGTLITYWDPVAGGSNAPVTTVVEYDCAGQGNYYLQVVSTNGCGISYRLKYETLSAVYANDTEPNNTSGQATALAHNTFTDGHINFNHYGDNDDWYSIQTPGDGALSITAIAERVPAADGNIRVHLYDGGGNQITYWDPVAGGGSAALTTVVGLECVGQGTYYLRVIGINGCGISYRLKYELVQAVFGNDPEPNGTFAQALALNPDSTSASGHINFSYYAENDDHYRVVLPSGGDIAFNLEAENGGGGTLRVHLYSSVGNLITYTDHPVGASHAPATSSVAFNALGAGLYYLRLVSVAGCGISYRLNCNDGDNDGTCNYFDLCPGGPEPGTPCDDGSACTADDVITGGCACAGTPVTCNDNDPCTTDSCNPLLGCVFTPSPDTDNDGTCDLTDGCPNDANKTSPGNCGCGNPEPGALCNDNNPLTINDVIGGNCLCAGTPVSCTGNGDCNDNDPCTSDACDNNVCVFTPLPDGDGDGTCDAQDGCPADPNKTAPGICGCGVSDVDTDSDGTADCNDGCPNDANKTAPGICGCGLSDVDTDSDGTADCNDGCPNDANKTTPGICGCGVSDADTDSDGTVDCNDGCPNDASKIAPGICGCGVSDADTDSDGTADCNDGCPNDASKTSPGTCGCGNPEPGATCDDGNANTINDVIGTNCLCAGTPIGGCQPTQLTTTPNPVVTCGIINVKLDGTTTLWADEVPGANRYQYLFTNIPGQPVYSRSIAGPTRSRQLFQWYTTPLKAGRTYRVQVRASFDGGNTWCPYGQVCTIRISNQPNPLFRDLEQGEDLSDATTAEPTLSLLPNPVRDGRVMLLIDGLSTVPGHVARIEVFDAMGRSVLNDQISQANLASGQLLDLQGQGKGLYLVQVSLNNERFVERLILH